MYISFSNTPEHNEQAETGEPTRRRAPGVRTVSSTVISLGIVSMLTDISSESVAAILPLYITGVLGLSTIAFGILDGLYQGTSALVRIGAGYVSDRVEQPKWVAFVGYALAAVARIGLLFASGFAAITAVVTADRIGKGIRTAPRDALITATSRADNLGTSFGVHRTLDNIGAAIGPLVAFFILLVIPDGFQIVFIASLAFAIIGVAILGLLVPNVRTGTKGAKSASATSTAADAAPVAPAKPKFDWAVVTTGPMRRVLAAAGILGLLTIGDGFIYLVLQSRSDFAALWFPLMYVGTNVAFLAFAIPMGRLADKVGRARVFVFGHVALLAAYFIAAMPIADIAATVLCLILLGLFYATTDGVLAALAAQLTTPDTHGTGIAAAQTVVAIARFFSAVGFGFLWYAIGREQSVLVVAVLLAIAIPLVALLLRPFLSSPASRIVSNRAKWILVILISVVAIGATVVVAVLAWQQYQVRQNAPSVAETTSSDDWASGDRVVFRNTASGQGYGLVASVKLSDPAGLRAVTNTACDRVDATDVEFMCLRTERGIAPSYTATLYSNDAEIVSEWPLPGIPSRTRISDDSALIASTAFVTGHSYATVGFSTETVIRNGAGESVGNLEEFTFVVDGAHVAPVDRNFWGVSFIDDATFYATAQTGGKTYMIQGDLDARTLTTVADEVECPSLSPDGTRVAFKRVTSGSGPTVHWTPAILDLASGDVELLPERRNVDDQIEWLDDDTILYGLPREGVPGDTDVWRLPADGSGEPEVFIEHAWSPAVVTE